MKDFVNLFRGNKEQTAEKPAENNPSQPAKQATPAPVRSQNPVQRTTNPNQSKASVNSGTSQRPPQAIPHKSTEVASSANRSGNSFGGGDSGSAKAEIRSSRASAASPEEIEKLLNFRGTVITAPGSQAPITPAQAMYVALLAQGSSEYARNELVISRKHYAHPDTSSAKSYLRLHGQTWVKETLVDMDIIHQIYAKHETIHGTGQAKSKATSPASEVAHRQREFLSLVQRAAEMKASDIHLTIGRNFALVRFRVDGELRKVDEMPIVVANELCQAAFAMADASDPTYNSNEYQGARVTDSSLKGAKFPEGVQSIRLQFNPLPSSGRYMIARLLYSQKVGSNSDVDELGYAPIQVQQIQAMRQKPFGINIISGPTGSGKSTTLQRGLTALMREKPGGNVITIEDPPEYVIEGAAQLPVTNAKTAEERSEKFRQAITASLRSDPDVVMIGEIRDSASAQLAFEAAMTGHGVWASLHANNASSILDRLRDQKIELYKLCDETLVTGLIGQRLLKKIKKGCEIDFEEAASLGFMTKAEEAFMRENVPQYLGRVRFAATHRFPTNHADAFAGRRVVAEVIEPDQVFLDLIRDERKHEAVKHWKENLNGITMLEHAFVLVCTGQLDIREMRFNVGSLVKIDKNRIPTIMRLVADE